MRFPNWSVQSSRQRGGVWSVLVLALLLAGCASPRAVRPSKAPPAVPTTVSAATILGEPIGSPELEVELLGKQKTAPALLRRAFLELRLGHSQAAIDATAEVLYGPEKPSANVESFARYLRAEAYAQKGCPELGSFDLDRARQLAFDPELLRRLPAPAAGNDPAVGDEAGDGPTVQRRAVWSAQAPNRRTLFPMTRPTRLTIHHSAVYFRDTRTATCAAQIQRIQRDHMKGEGWADIGYHFLIDPAGRIWEGRELRWQGAHAEGDNNIGNIGICVLGNFLRGRGGQQPTRNQLDSMRHLTTHLMKRYEFGADAIHVHRDFKATQCPGPLLESAVTQMARDLSRVGPGRVAKP